MNDQDYSIHKKINEIKQESGSANNRKTEISRRITTGDLFTKAALIIAFWGFWIFWIIVALI